MNDPEFQEITFAALAREIFEAVSIDSSPAETNRLES